MKNVLLQQKATLLSPSSLVFLANSTMLNPQIVVLENLLTILARYLFLTDLNPVLLSYLAVVRTVAKLKISYGKDVKPEGLIVDQFALTVRKI